MKNNPIGFIIALVAALVAAFITWYNHSIKVQAVTQGLFASIKALGKNLVEFWTGVWKIISGAATFNPKRIKEGINTLKKSMSDWGGEVADAYQKAYDKRMASVKKEKATKPSTDGTVVPPDILDDPDNPNNNDPYKEKLERLDAGLQAEQVLLKKNYADGIKTEEEYNVGLLDLLVKYLVEKRNLYKKDSVEYNDYESQLLDIEINKKKDANAAQLKVLQDSFKATQIATDVYEQKKREDLQNALDNGKISQEEFNRNSIALDVALAEMRLQTAKDYAELISDAKYDSEDEKTKAVQAATESVNAANAALLKAKQAVNKNELQEEKDHLDKVAKLRQELGLDKEKLSYQEGLDALKKKLKDAEASEKESADKIAAYKIGKAQEYAEQASQFVNVVADLVSTANENEIAGLEEAKQRELTAAGNNAEARAAIEQEYAQKELDLKKKQADANMGIAIAQALAEGALGIAKIWAVNGINPVYAGILTALLTGITALQIGTAIKQRNIIKSTSIGSSGSSSVGASSGKMTATGLEDGGYVDVTRAQDGKRYSRTIYDPSRRGYVDSPTILVGDGPAGRSREWVASNDAVNNPTIAPLLAVLDQAQQAGMIRTLDMNRAIRTNMAGFASGGPITFPASRSESKSSGSPKSGDINATLSELDRTIKNLQEYGLSADVSLSDFERKQNLRNKARKIGSK